MANETESCQPDMPITTDPRLLISQQRSFLARFRRRLRRAHATTSNTASRADHEKINARASFTFLYGYSAPPGDR